MVVVLEHWGKKTIFELRENLLFLQNSLKFSASINLNNSSGKKKKEKALHFFLVTATVR